MKSFPGGKYDETVDSCMRDTAFREAYEEISLKEDNLDFICQLCPFISPVGHYIVPIIALLKDNRNETDPYSDCLNLVKELKPNPDEVEGIFWMPFQYILDSEFIGERIGVLNTKLTDEQINLIREHTDLSMHNLKSFNRILINFSENLFRNRVLPMNPYLYGINASVLIFVILTVMPESEFSFQVEENYLIRSDTIESYVKDLKLFTYLLYKMEKIKKISKRIVSKL